MPSVHEGSLPRATDQPAPRPGLGDRHSESPGDGLHPSGLRDQSARRKRGDPQPHSEAAEGDHARRRGCDVPGDVSDHGPAESGNAALLSPEEGPVENAGTPRGHRLTRGLTRTLIGLVKTYRLVRSGYPSHCRFIPTCSEYALEALERHGPYHGSLLTIRRLLRCHPLGPYGADPVPL